MRAIKPVFSGDVDPLINQLDYQKIRARLSSQHGRASLNDREVILTEEFLAKRRELDRKMLLTGLWGSVSALGSTPDSREGSAGCLVGDDFCMFGGFSREIFGDLRYFEAADQKWRLI